MLNSLGESCSHLVWLKQQADSIVFSSMYIHCMPTMNQTPNQILTRQVIYKEQGYPPVECIIYLLILLFSSAPLAPTIRAWGPIATALPSPSTQDPLISVTHPDLLPHSAMPSAISINTICVYGFIWIAELQEPSELEQPLEDIHSSC